MPSLAAALLSIWILAALAWVVRRRLNVAVCPVCVGVAGTWIWMLIGRRFGLAVDGSMLTLLMGGSVVGIAYQLERHLPAGRSPMLWKSLFVPLGFGAAYALEQAIWWLLAAMLVALIAVAATFFASARAQDPPQGAAVAELKKQMERCC